MTPLDTAQQVVATLAANLGAAVRKGSLWLRLGD